MSMAADYSNPLPQCDGPKLRPFPNCKDIKFVRLLGDVEAEGHSHVFEVSIGSNSYALKW